MRKFLFLFLSLFHFQITHAQSDTIDNLMTTLSRLENKDTTYVNIACDLAFRLSMVDQQKSGYYIDMALAIAKDLQYEKGHIRALILKGNSFLILGLADQALSFYLKASSYNIHQYPMEYVRLNNNIGEVYRRKEMYDSSLKHLNIALKTVQNHSKAYRPIIIYNNLGEIHFTQGNIAKAKYYFHQCLTNSLEIDDLRGEGYGYYGLAVCSFEQQTLKDSAIFMMHQSMDARLKASHQRGLIQSYLKLGEFYTHPSVSFPDSSIYYWRKAEYSAKRHQANDLLSDAYNHLYNSYFNAADLKNASNYLSKQKTLNDSLQNAEFDAEMATIKSALRSELVMAENKLLKQEKLQRKSEDITLVIILSFIFLILIGLGYFFFLYKKRQLVIEEAESESRFKAALLRLTNELNKKDLDVNEFIKKALGISRITLGCDRATYWDLNEEYNEISLVSFDERRGIPPTHFQKIKDDHFPIFINKFLSQRAIAISEISKNPSLKDVYDIYFKFVGIESFIISPILVRGKFMGFVAYMMAYNRVRKWEVREERFIGSLTDLIVAAIAKNQGDKLEKDKEGLIKKLKVRNKSLKEFNNIISHNLREPLTQIIGFSELLKHEDAVENSADMIHMISNASNRIDKVIKELSTILNEKEPKPSDFRVLSLKKLIKEVLDLHKNEIESMDVAIKQHLTFDKIKSYKPFLSDALYHLISNSIKFSYPDKPLVINIESYEDELHQYIKISDNGRGMNLSQVNDKIFKMYQRFHLDTEGRGIGLFITKNRINAINGFISVESEEGMGTAFTIEFPRESPAIMSNE